MGDRGEEAASRVGEGDVPGGGDPAAPVRPLGPFRPQLEVDRVRRRALLRALAGFPGDLRGRVGGLSPEALATPIRPGGWTVGQVVHHLADSHVVGYVRCREAATNPDSPGPSFRADAWMATMGAGKGMPVDPSLRLLRLVHNRWVRFLRGLQPQHFQREYLDPERGPVTVDLAVQYYVWHGRHHLAQVVGALRTLPPSSRPAAD
jgi:hypothetical protein